jgi:lipopolysaccharide transport system permease protein
MSIPTTADALDVKRPSGTPAADPRERTASRAPRTLPEKPLVSIRPARGWVPLNLLDVWSYRELLYFFVWRDVKVRYKQTAFGVAWAVIQPLFTMLIFTLFFGKLAGMPSDGIPYAVFAYSGLLPWTFFSNAVTNGGNSLVGNQNLLTKVYFPRMIIPAATVAAGLVDFAIAFVLLAGLMAWYAIVPTWSILMIPLLTLLTCLLALGVGMWMSALNVRFRDVRYVLPFGIQLWMFLSPIIYPPTIVPERWRWALALNPLSGIIGNYRSALFGRPFDWTALAVSAVVTFAILICSAYYFRRMESRFADIV